MTTVYQLDPQGIFLGEETGYESPLEPGVTLIPAGCVTIAPPMIPSGYRARFAGGAWILEIAPSVVPPTPEEPEAVDALTRAEQHVGSFFSTARLLQAKVWLDLLPREATPKLNSLFAWTGVVTGMALAGQTIFPAPPVAFLEVAQECIPLLT